MPVTSRQSSFAAKGVEFILAIKASLGFIFFLKKVVAFWWNCCYNTICCGVWRSLVARTAGGREVAGSNPVAPIFL